MEESLKTALQAAGQNAEYDEHAKYLLSHRIVLAHILVHVISEFKGMNPENVVQLIEGEPEVASVPVNPGETNKNRNRVMPVITGSSLESKIAEEGTVTYDVRFYAWLPNQKQKVKIIVDIEAQKKSNPGYDIVSRGVFYAARMVSAQLNTEFRPPDYNNIKKVYSIWICMNAPGRIENTAVLYSLQPQNIIGSKAYYGKYDLISVIEVNLGKKLAGEADELRLHRFLGTLFASELTADKKTEILKEEYRIQMSDDFERRLHLMCNLSEAIEEKGIEKGMEKGQYLQLYELIQSNDITLERAAEKKNITVEKFQEKLKEYNLI